MQCLKHCIAYYVACGNNYFQQKFFTMKKIILILSILLSLQTFAQQQGTLYIRGGEKVIVTNVKKLPKETNFYYKDSLQQNVKTSLPNWLIDSVVIGKIDTAKNTIVANTILADTTSKIISTTTDTTIFIQQPNPLPTGNAEVVEQPIAPQKNYTFNYALGITLGNYLEFNNAAGNDKKTLSFTGSLDINYRYNKPNAFITMSHELHYTFGIQKESLGGGTHLQRVQDDLLTLHDLSFRIKRNSKWNINAILKFSTSLFTIYSGEYFSDVNNLGKIKSFLSPYSLSIAPGLKYDVSNALKISLSPYSFEMFGVSNNEISSKGIYITDADAAGNFKKSIIRKQGMEFNFWLDKNVKQWLEMQYRLGINSDYKGGLGKNAIMDGLFITKAKIVKNIYLTHRATLYNNLAGNLLKPYFTQTVQISYSKNF